MRSPLKAANSAHKRGIRSWAARHRRYARYFACDTQSVLSANLPVEAAFSLPLVTDVPAFPSGETGVHSIAIPSAVCSIS